MTYNPSDGPISTAYTDLADGDDLDAASVEVWLEALSDSMEYCRLHGFFQVFGQTTSSLPDSFSTTRALREVGFTSTGGLPVIPGQLNSVIPTGDSVWLPVILPSGVELEAITVKINPANDALPTTNIQLSFWRVPIATGVPDGVQSITDPLTGASYQAEHDLTLTLSAPMEINNLTHTYQILMIGESGGGDMDDVVLVSAPRLSYSVASLDLG